MALLILSLVDLLNIDEYVVPEIQKLTKSKFDINSIISSAGELKYVSQIKKVLASLLNDPDEGFVKFIASKIHDGPVTAKIKEQLEPLVRKAASQYLNEQVNDRLKSAISTTTDLPKPVSDEGPVEQQKESEVNECKVITTGEELEGFYTVKAIVRKVVDCKRVILRDTQSYCGILLDDNNRKPICRLHFNRAQKYIGIFDKDKKENRIPIKSVDDIYNYSEQLRDIVKSYSDQT